MAIRISATVDEAAWKDLQVLSDRSGRTVSELLNEAICDYLRRKRRRPEVAEHLDASVTENRELGRLLDD